MTPLACLIAEDRIERRPRFDDAERLALEEHLEECERCRGYATFVDATRQLHGSVRVEALSAGTRARLLANAREGVEPARARSRAPQLVAAGLLLAGIAVAIVWSTGGPATPPTLGAEIVSLPAGASAQAGHARVRAIAPARVRFDAADAELYLARGSLEVEVDPQPRRPFAVRGERFVVRVLGTRFTVRPDGVTVQRGVVSIRALDGAVIVDRLAAGGAWTWTEETSGPASSGRELAARDAPGEIGPGADVAPSPEVAVSPTSTSDELVAEPGAEPDVEEPDVAEPDVAALLARARRLLAARRAAPALSTIRAALAAPRTRAQEAEARSLLADHALVAGDPERAIALYAAVGRGYRDLRAGDNAMFTAARLRARRGPPAEARALLQEYLRIFPRGRFRTEAARRLTETEGANE